MNNDKLIIKARSNGQSAIVAIFNLMGGDAFLQASQALILDAGVIEGRPYIHMELSRTKPNKVGASFVTIQRLPDLTYKISFWDNNRSVFYSVANILESNLRQRFTELTDLSTGAV